MFYMGSQSFKHFCFTITLQKYIWSLVAVSNSGNIILILLFGISSYIKMGIEGNVILIDIKIGRILGAGCKTQTG
jgi:hypothetical protein